MEPCLHTLAATLAERVLSFNKHQTRRNCLCIGLHLTNTRLTDAEKYVVEFRTRNRLKRNTTHTLYAMGYHGLLVFRKSPQQHECLYYCLHMVKLPRSFLIFNNLIHYLYCSFSSGHIAHCYLFGYLNKSRTRPFVTHLFYAFGTVPSHEIFPDADYTNPRVPRKLHALQPTLGTCLPVGSFLVDPEPQPVDHGRFLLPARIELSYFQLNNSTLPTGNPKDGDSLALKVLHKIGIGQIFSCCMRGTSPAYSH